MKSSKNVRSFLWFAITTVVFVFLLSINDLWQHFFGILFPDVQPVLHPRASVLMFFLEHCRITFAATALTAFFGLGAGIVFTRKSFTVLLPLARALSSFAQTIPPVAVLALSVPLFGFGPLPTILALFLYGIFPVFEGTVAGIGSIPKDALEAARGMGMRSLEILRLIEIPLATPFIVGGLRTSAIISVGTAMIGAITGGGGLGSPVSAGLSRDNPAFVLEGVIPAAGLAIILDRAFAFLKTTIDNRGSLTGRV